MAFSRLSGGLRIGTDWFERRGLRSSAPALGIVDRLADLGNPGLDVTRVHPAVVQFFEDTASLDLRIESRWRFPFSVLFWLARPLLRAVGQFVLPMKHARIATQTFGLDRDKDGRPDVRAVVRTYDDGGPMQVVAYATSREGESGYMNAAFPLPLGNLTGILRLDVLAEDTDGHLAVVLTSERRSDHTGVWFVIFGVPLRLPFGERFALWPAGSSSAPPDLERGDASLVGRHEQTLFGIRVVTHDYRFRPRA